MKVVYKMLFFIFCSIFFSCKTNYNGSVRGNMTPSVVGDSVKKTGYLIYDTKKGFISFVELKPIDINSLSKKDIVQMTNEAKYIVLMRAGLDKFKKSQYISLSLCHISDERLVVETDNLLYKRFYITYLDGFIFYKSLKKYPDTKQRLFFCEDGK